MFDPSGLGKFRPADYASGSNPPCAFCSVAATLLNAAQVPERPTIFMLYEQHIGMLTPLLAEQFVTQSAQVKQPFYVAVNVYAPHTPSIPAPRPRNSLPRSIARTAAARCACRGHRGVNGRRPLGRGRRGGRGTHPG